MLKVSTPRYDTVMWNAQHDNGYESSANDTEDVTMEEVTTTKAVCLDHKAFPHITEKIFAYSSLSTLNDLSRAGPEFSSMAHRMSARRHLIITLSRHDHHMDVGLSTPLGPIPGLGQRCKHEWTFESWPEDCLARIVLRDATRVEIRGNVTPPLMAPFAPYLSPTMVFRTLGRDYPITAPVVILQYNMCPRKSTVRDADDGSSICTPTTVYPLVPRTRVDTLVFAVQYCSGFPSLVIDPAVDGTLFDIDPLQPMPRHLVLHFARVEVKTEPPVQPFSQQNLAAVADLVRRALATAGTSGHTKVWIVGLENISYSWIVCPSWGAPAGNTWLATISNELGRRLGVNWADLAHCRVVTNAEYQVEHDRSHDDISFERGMEMEV